MFIIYMYIILKYGMIGIIKCSTIAKLVLNNASMQHTESFNFYDQSKSIDINQVQMKDLNNL